MIHPRLLLAIALPVLCSACALPVREMPPDHVAAGEFGNGDNAWRLRDAAAVNGPEGLILIFTRLTFDRKKWVQDAQLTYDDLTHFLDNEVDYAPELDIKLNADGGYAAHRLVYAQYGATWRVDPALEHGVSLRVNDGRRIAGTLHFDGQRSFAAIDFDLPVLTIGPTPRPGVPLPADGGAPGHTLLARSDAIYNGDLDRLLSLLSPEEYSHAVGHYKYDSDDIVDYAPGDLEQSGASFYLLKQRMDTPRIRRITGGSVDGTTAWVDFEGSEEIIGHDPVTGTALMTQDKRGHWWIEELTTQSQVTSGADE
ncbi:MAG: hypothetical protein ABIS07_10760 [Dokdonella sp.]